MKLTNKIEQGVEVTGHTSSSPTGTEYHFSSQDQLKPGGGMSLSQTTRKQELKRERERERERVRIMYFGGLP